MAVNDGKQGGVWGFIPLYPISLSETHYIGKTHPYNSVLHDVRELLSNL
jgi:hypothetical protein